MTVTAEISLYPLATKDYADKVWEYIRSIQQDENLDINVDGMSTLVTGDYENVMQIFTKTTQRFFEELPSAIILLKMANSDRRKP